MPDDIIDQAVAAMEGVTPGPWEPIFHQHDTSYPSDTYNVITEYTGDLVAEVDDESRGYEEPHGDFGRDAYFIAWARTGVPALVAELKTTRAELKRVRGALSNASAEWVKQADDGDYVDDGEEVVLRDCAETVEILLNNGSS